MKLKIFHNNIEQTHLYKDISEKFQSLFANRQLNFTIGATDFFFNRIQYPTADRMILGRVHNFILETHPSTERYEYKVIYMDMDEDLPIVHTYGMDGTTH